MKFPLAVLALVALAVGSTAVGSTAQQPAVLRMQHPGRVFDTEGKPVAAAEVTFVTGPRQGAKSGDDEVVRTTSGTDGRFQIALVPGRSYVAWALQRHGADVQLTRFQPSGGTSTTLRVEDVRRPATTEWHVGGVEAWRAHGPLTLQVLVQGSAKVVPEVVVDASGEAAVPTLPMGPLVVRLFARDRLVHVWENVSAGDDMPLRQPALVAVRVNDAAGQPVPEATIVRHWPSTPSHHAPGLGTIAEQDAWPLAVTGQDGTADVLAAMDPMQLFLGNGGVKNIAVQKEGLLLLGPPGRAGGVLQFRLGAFPGLRGQVLLGHLPAPAWARFSTEGEIPGSSPVVAFDRAGGIDLPSDPVPRGKPRQVAWVTAASPELVDGDPFRAVASPHPLLIPVSRLREEGGLDLAEVVPVRIQVLTADGMPAAGANVWCAPQIDGRGAPTWAPTWQAVGRVADPSGRVVLNALPGPWLVAAVDAGQLRHTVVEVNAGMQVQTLKLGALETVTVHVVDADGRAVVGAGVAVSSPSMLPCPYPHDAWLQQFCAGLAMERPPVATDATGAATLHFARTELSGCEFAIVANLGTRVARGTLEPNAASVRIVMP